VHAQAGRGLTPSLLVDGALLAAAAVVAAAAAVLFARNASTAAWTLIGVFAVAEAIVPPLGLQVTRAGLTIYAMDLVVAIMFAIGLWRLVSRPNQSVVLVPLGALSVLFAFHAMWGIVTFGLQDGVNGSRSWLYLIGPLVFASQASPRWTRRSFIPLIVGATALSLFALFSLARHGLHGANDYITIHGELVDARPVMAKGALLIVQCLLLAMTVRFARSGVVWLAIASMASAALLLQYRTIWIVALVVALVAYTRWARLAIIVNKRAALGAASAVLLVTPVVLALTVSSSAFGQSVHSATSQDSTLDWRWKSWTLLLDAHSSIQDRVLGLPAGTPLDRTIGNIVWTQSPHSLYVDALLSLGALGVALFVYLWVVIVRRRQRAGVALGIGSTLVVVVVFSQAIFGITNMLDPAQGLLLGMLLQAACATRPDSPRGGIVPSGARFERDVVR
jgi:hypothetical protein